MNKTKYFLLLTFIFVLISSSSVAFAQSTQNLILKPGFNFVSFSVTPTVSAAAFKSANPAIENIFVYSAAAGSFLSVNEGTLTTLAAGKGYIVKNSNTSDLTIAILGSVPATIGNINLKTGFNLIGFAKTPVAVTFNKLMDVYPIIKGLYKWSTSAGGFIQVIRNESGVPVQLDGINPSFKAGESYFINMTGDTTLNYDGADVVVGSGPAPVAVAKTLEVSGPIGSTLNTPYLTSISRLIDNSGYRISIFDEINNQPLEDSTVSFIAADTYRAVIKTASTTKYASIIIKNLENKVVYKIFLGRIPKSEEISDSSIKVTNLRIDDSSTAKAIVFISYKEKIPSSALIANKSLDASIEETVFMKETKYSFGNINSIVIVLERVTSVIRGVLAKDSIESYIRDFVEVSTYNSLGNTLNAYVKLISFYDYLSYKQNISIPGLINIGNVVIKEGSTSETVQAALSEAGLLINKSILKTIELDKVTDSVLIGKQYDLSLINAMAVYSDNSKKKIIPYWKRQSGQGTVWVNSGKWVFDAPGDSSETILYAGYDEDGGAVTKTAQLTLRIVPDKPLLTKITLSKVFAEIPFNAFYNLSDINVTAFYSDNTNKAVIPIWNIKNGKGSINNNVFAASSELGVTVLTASYSENDIVKEIEFAFTVSNNIVSYKNGILPSTGGELSLDDQIYLNIAPGIINKSAEVTIKKINYQGYANTSDTIVFEINSNLDISQSTIYIPLSFAKEGQNYIKDYISVESYDNDINAGKEVQFSLESFKSLLPAKAPNKDIPFITDNVPGRTAVKISLLVGTVVVLTGIQSYKFYVNVQKQIKPTKLPNMKLSVPFYAQYSNTCLINGFLMLMKAYDPNLYLNEKNYKIAASTIYKLCHNIRINDSVGIDGTRIDDAGLLLMNGLDEITKAKCEVKKYNVSKEYSVLMNDIISSLNNEYPVILRYPADGSIFGGYQYHSIVIHGYDCSKCSITNDKYDDLSNLSFSIRDPNFPLEINKIETYAEMKKLYWDSKYLSELRLYVPNMKLSSDKSNLITIHHSKEYPWEVELNSSKRYKIYWNSSQIEGYSFGINDDLLSNSNIISNLSNIVYNDGNLAISNADENDRDIVLKVGVYRNNNYIQPNQDGTLCEVTKNVHIKAGTSINFKNPTVPPIFGGISCIDFEQFKSKLLPDDYEFYVCTQIVGCDGYVINFKYKPPVYLSPEFTVVHSGENIELKALIFDNKVPVKWRIISGSGTLVMSTDNLVCNFKGQNDIGKLYYDADENIVIEAYTDKGTIATKTIRLIRPKLKYESDDTGSWWYTIYDRYSIDSNGNIDTSNHLHGKCHRVISSYVLCPFTIDTTYYDGLINGLYSEKYIDNFYDGIRREGNYNFGKKEGFWKEIPYNSSYPDYPDDTSRGILYLNEYVQGKLIKTTILPR